MISEPLVFTWCWNCLVVIFVICPGCCPGFWPVLFRPRCFRDTHLFCSRSASVWDTGLLFLEAAIFVFSGWLRHSEQKEIRVEAYVWVYPVCYTSAYESELGHTCEHHLCNSGLVFFSRENVCASFKCVCHQCVQYC